MTSRQYDVIDESVGAEIKRLHNRHPKLGHDGLLDALRHQEIHVDPEKLDSYMKEHRIRADRSWRPWNGPGFLGGGLAVLFTTDQRDDGGYGEND
jgi:hypothetical protein